MNSLPSQVASLQQFFNKSMKPRDPAVMYSRLHAFMQLLNITNSAVTIEVSFRSFTCVLCQQKTTSRHQFLRLECQCSAVVCGIDCFRMYVFRVTGETLTNLDMIPCPKCQFAIAKMQVVHAFTDMELFSRWQAASSPQLLAPAANYTCGICGLDLQPSSLCPLPCVEQHKYCEECVQGWITTKLGDGQADIRCPKNDCTEQVPQSCIRKLAPEMFEQYMKLLASISVQPRDTEIVFDCPSPDCPNRILVDKRVMDYTCVVCSKRYCPQCRSPVHLTMTCQQYFDHLQEELKKHLDQLKNDEGATENYFKQMGIKPCPNCKVPIQKISGCKFVTCLSGICQGKTYLCMDCGKQLPGDHANHPCP